MQITKGYRIKSLHLYYNLVDNNIHTKNNYMSQHILKGVLQAIISKEEYFSLRVCSSVRIHRVGEQGKKQRAVVYKPSSPPSD